MSDLRQLADLIKQKWRKISEIINRPALIEYSKISDIELVDSAAKPLIDGYFRSGKAKGKNPLTLNVSTYVGTLTTGI